MYKEIVIGGETYKLRLTTKASVALEKALGRNPMYVFTELDDGDMPKLADILIMFHAMLQPLHHGITLEKAYDIFDQYVEDGYSMIDMIPIFIEVFQMSGYLPKATDAKEVNEKN